MTPRIAWAAAAAVDGRRAAWLDDAEHARLVRRITAHVGDDWRRFSRWLSSRQDEVTHYWGAPGDVGALIAETGVLVTGVAAARAHQADLGTGGHGEVYTSPDRASRLVDDFFLVRSETGNITIRTSAEDWPLLAGQVHLDHLVAPRLVVAVDLLEADDSRSRAAGRKLLARALRDWHP